MPFEKQASVDVLETYLGLDFSTQQVKAIVINDEQEILQEAVVQFDSDLPEYRTHGGVNADDDAVVVTAPVIMWVKALDMLMDKLRVAGTNFSAIKAISGSGQQHGSVYWRKGASTVLKNLQPNYFLYEQLSSSFAIYDCPVWMDSSTSLYCQKLEEMVGGPQVLADLTGSRAFERFTGHQIAKIYQTKKDMYDNTERISLVSSFACSLFCGEYAPIDYSDGCGMNLLDIRTKSWSQKCLDACAPGLRERLGDPVPSNHKTGMISEYFVNRYDFSPECCIVAFTGDNPASLAGMCLQRGDLAISLGTSDCLFLWLENPHPSVDGCVYINPINEDSYMALLCFKNGSLARERIRDKCSDGSWDIFGQLLETTQRGNFGNIAMYYFQKEITPQIEGVFRFNKSGEEVDRYASSEVEVRALIEGQFIAKRLYAQKLGIALKNLKRIFVTGGASASVSILRVISDVFNAPVYTMKAINSACLGAAYQAKCGSSSRSFEEVIQCPQITLVCYPNQDSAQIYDPMVARFEKLETEIKQKQKLNV